MNPSEDRLLAYFKDRPDWYTKRTDEVYAAYESLAESLVATFPSGPERSVALRKLLESRDAMERLDVDFRV